MGSLPHVAAKLVAGKPVVIVAFGSSSTQGWGSTSPEFTYPNRLAAQLRRQYPGADITVLNRGKGGEDAPEMMKRLQTEVIDVNPDLVIWQVGTNAVLRNLDPAETAKLVEDGIGRIQAAGADLVLVDPQYSPAVNAKAENASRMVQLLGKVAELRHVGFFPRFEVMRDWHEKQSMPFESFVVADGLHMNDWGYACFAQLLGDDIIKSVGQIKLGVNVPANVSGLSADVSSCPGRSAARRSSRRGALQSRGRNAAPPFGTVPALRSGMKNAASRPGHETYALSSAATKSSIRSSRCSSPAENRTKPSLMPSSARASGVSR